MRKRCEFFSEETDNTEPKEKLRVFQHFLVECEFKNRRHRVLNISISNLNRSLVNKILDYPFKGLKFATKVNLAIGFVSKNIDDGFCT